MIGYEVRFCDYSHWTIVAGQRWERGKGYEARPSNRDVASRHFHAEVFGRQGLSCSGKYWTEREIARTAVTGRNTCNEQAMRLVA
jgi:hypothetical protein